ncbi:MAG: hypothetical protein PHS54_01265 [Clostridia bacterium]|nr:hypothetical protein [Clostridia bacterium]
MEHKFTIEVILKYDGPNETPKQNVQAVQIDPVVLKNILGPILSTLTHIQVPKNKEGENKDGKEKKD